MTEIYEAETRLEAWVRATWSLFYEDQLNVDKYDRTNVVLEIHSPTIENSRALRVREDLDEMYKEAEKESTHSVSEWIFPGWLYQREGIQGVYETYPEQLEMILAASGRWGTYAGRLVEQKNPKDGTTFNPLKKLIEKMRQNHESDGGTFHSCYEIDVLQGPFDIPLYDSATDRKKPRNLPCLSHLSFDLFEDEVHLTAFYRSHDYRFKVPGNLLGLARLQDCVAEEVGVDAGNLVVHSSRAKINKEGGIPEFRNLIDRLSEDIVSDSEAKSD